MENQSLISLFGDMPDPRLDRKKLHNLGDIITIAILAVICGAESWVDIEEFGEARYEWLKSFLELENDFCYLKRRISYIMNYTLSLLNRSFRYDVLLYHLLDDSFCSLNRLDTHYQFLDEMIPYFELLY